MPTYLDTKTERRHITVAGSRHDKRLSANEARYRPVKDDRPTTPEQPKDDPKDDPKGDPKGDSKTKG